MNRRPIDAGTVFFWLFITALTALAFAGALHRRFFWASMVSFSVFLVVGVLVETLWYWRPEGKLRAGIKTEDPAPDLSENHESRTMRGDTASGMGAEFGGPPSESAVGSTSGPAGR